MADIKPGTIGVNTADDSGELLLVLYAEKHALMARPLAGGVEQVFPASNFWPLITNLKIEGE